jgi:hypothetical protein
MPVILYRDVNFAGPSVRLQPGFFSGRDDLEGKTRGSSYGEDLSDEISSVRVDSGYIAVLYGGFGPSASGGGARTLVGPTEIADLGTIGMNDAVSSAEVFMYTNSQSVAVPRDFGVTLYETTRYGSQPWFGGIHIGQGDYDRTRLDSDEVKIGAGGIQAVCVGPNTLVILYEGATFDSTLDSVVLGPGQCVSDVQSLGMTSGSTSKINSVRVLYASVSGLGASDSGLSSIAQGPTPLQRAIDAMGPGLSRRVGGQEEPKRPIFVVMKAGGLAPAARGRDSAAAAAGKDPSALRMSDRMFYLVLLVLLVVIVAILAPGQSAQKMAATHGAAAPNRTDVRDH